MDMWRCCLGVNTLGHLSKVSEPLQTEPAGDVFSKDTHSFSLSHTHIFYGVRGLASRLGFCFMSTQEELISHESVLPDYFLPVFLSYNKHVAPCSPSVSPSVFSLVLSFHSSEKRGKTRSMSISLEADLLL